MLVHPRHPVDRVIGHAGDQVSSPAFPRRERFCVVLRNRFGLPLVGVAPHKPVEVLEAHADGPLVEGTDLAGCEGRRVVISCRTKEVA